MNKERRKAIGEKREAIDKIKGELEDRLNELNAEFQGKLEGVKSEIEVIRDEEQEYYDNMPESFQNGEKGQASQSAIDALEEVIGNMEDFDLDATNIVEDMNFGDITGRLEDAEE